jgi:two-component system chemotaxis response regulator CheB
MDGTRIRVLVVDDSVVIRRLVRHALESDPQIEVVGAAANGLIALQMIPQVNPDVVTLDIEMPELDGLSTLKEIKTRYPGVFVIMFSTLSERGAKVTLEALAVGASDYVTKAANVGSLEVSMNRLREELVPKLKQFFVMEVRARRRDEPALKAGTPISEQASPRRIRVDRSCRAIAIGVSTGGPTALAAIVSQFPRGLSVPVFIVQHMPKVFTKLLAERLQSLTPLTVTEAAAGDKVEAGHVYIAPGDFHLTLAKRGEQVILETNQDAPENSCRPAVDVLFRSVARTYPGQAVAAILTGMGQDGLRGAEVLKAEGCRVIAQDEATSVVWGMPGAVANAGLADTVVPLPCIVPEILKHV